MVLLETGPSSDINCLTPPGPHMVKLVRGLLVLLHRADLQLIGHLLLSPLWFYYSRGEPKTYTLTLRLRRHYQTPLKLQKVNYEWWSFAEAQLYGCHDRIFDAKRKKKERLNDLLSRIEIDHVPCCQKAKDIFKKLLTVQLKKNQPLGVWSVCVDLKTVCIHCHHFRQIDSLPWLAHARAGLNPVWRLLWARSHRCRLCRRRRHRCRQSHYALFRLSATKSVKKGL